MKRAVILHGTNATPERNWFPWLKQYLEDKGYQVWVPELPANDTPNRSTYNDFLFSSDWDFSDNLIVGHSSGAVSVLNLVDDDRCPHVNTAVMVGVWTDNAGTHLDPERFANLFPEGGFDIQKIKNKTSHLLFVHGSEDPTCPLQQAKDLAAATNGDLVIVPGGNHLAGDYPQLPRLTDALEARNWL